MPVQGVLDQQAALVQDADAVGRALDLGEDVAGDEDRAAVLAVGVDRLAHLADPVRIEPADRLVEDQQVRLVDERADEAQFLAHAARVVARGGMADLPEVERVEQLVHARLRLGRRAHSRAK